MLYFKKKYLAHLKVTKVLLLPLVPKHGNPLKKTSFPPEFCNEICTIYIWTIKKSEFCKKKKKKNENVVPFQNGGQITDFYFASFRFWKKKDLFPKGIFQWNLAQNRRTWIHLHYWNNIFKKLFRFKMVAKTIFWYCAKMIIYAKLARKRRCRFKICLRQEKRIR